jgi:hypothetical protein
MEHLSPRRSQKRGLLQLFLTKTNNKLFLNGGFVKKPCYTKFTSNLSLSDIDKTYTCNDDFSLMNRQFNGKDNFVFAQKTFRVF